MKTAGKKKSDLGLQPEVRLFEQAQAGCEDSLALLMDKHKPLVIHAIKRQNLGDLPVEEAVQAGWIGLWQAIRKYNPHKGYQFSTYAYGAIVHQVWAAVKDHCIANRKEHATREWAVFLRHWEVGPAQQQRQQELKACLQTLVGGLPKRQQQIIQVRYEQGGTEWQTLAELGVEWGVSGERVRQLQVEALVWLRHPAHSQELRTLLRRHSQQEYEWAEEIAQAWLRRRGGRRG